jgi:hypothetical protein
MLAVVPQAEARHRRHWQHHHRHYGRVYYRTYDYDYYHYRRPVRVYRYYDDCYYPRSYYRTYRSYPRFSFSIGF